jgi:hypothetical protein
MKNFIEVNGKRYDSQTGKLINQPSRVSGFSVDGMAPKKHNNLVKPTAVHKKRPIEKSHTLLRQAVKKPITAKRTNTEKTTKSPRSPLISKYGSVFTKIEKRVEPLMYVQPKTEANITSTVNHGSLPSTSQSLIDKALSISTSHQMSAHKPLKRHKIAGKLGIKPRTLRAGSLMLAFLVLGVFFAYQNVPNFAMRVASTRAGFAAQMPGYQPSGFAVLGPVQYKSGEVTVSFGSKTGDGREFELTQKTSDWNNDALLANIVASKPNYQTLQDGNQTIYLYDGSNATWVKNGVWYQIEGDSRLTSDQISRLASSF